MTTVIKLNRKDLIAKLASVKEDNISIADVAINRQKLLAALKLQTEPDADVLTLTYGRLSFEDKYKTQGYYSYWREVKVDNEPCVQFSCNHTTMRFLNRPKAKYGQVPKVIPLNFIDYRTATPSKPELDGTPLDTQALLDALTFVQHGVAIEEGRPVLCCILFDSTKESTLKLVAADGYRLSMASIPVSGLPSDRVIVHSKDIAKLIAWLKSNTTGKGKRKAWLDTYVKHTEGTNSNIEGKNGTVKFSSENSTLEFEKRIGTYPNYDQLIPKDGTKVEFIADDMLEAAKALRNIANDGSGIIRLHFNIGKPCGKITLTAKSEEYGESSVDCDAIVESDCKIGINYKYLIDLLSVCRDSKVMLRLTTPSSPMVYTIGDTRTEVIMPMFIQW